MERVPAVVPAKKKSATICQYDLATTNILLPFIIFILFSSSIKTNGRVEANKNNNTSTRWRIWACIQLYSKAPNIIPAKTCMLR